MDRGVASPRGVVSLRNKLAALSRNGLVSERHAGEFDLLQAVIRRRSNCL